MDKSNFEIVDSTNKKVLNKFLRSGFYQWHVVGIDNEEKTLCPSSYL